MRIVAIALCLLAGCAGLPPDGTPYFESTASGDNLYPATQTRIYATDQRVEIHQPHPQNGDKGYQSITVVSGGFADGLEALENLPALTRTPVADDTLLRPDSCCHVFIARSFRYFDGQTVRAISEAVWRQAAGIPPFVDEPLARN